MGQNTLRTAMLEVQGKTETTERSVPNPTPAPSKRTFPSRDGKRAMTIWISPEAYRQLHLIGLDTGASVQDMGVEAVNDFFRKHNKSAVA
jgi:hypothetical protein